MKERDIDDGTIKQRKLLVETTSPAALSEIRGFSDFPVPQLFSRRSRSASETRKSRAEAATPRPKSSRSNSEARSVDGGSSAKFAAAFGSTKLVTKIKVTQDKEKLAERRAMTESQSPAQLGNITSLGDFPLPTTLERFMKSSDKKPKAAAAATDAEEPKSGGGGLNLEDMYSNLPRSFKSEVLVKSKVHDNDEEKITQRRKIVESMKPAELAQINSLGEFPMPSALESIFKSSDRPKPPSRKKQDMEEKRK